MKTITEIKRIEQQVKSQLGHVEARLERAEAKFDAKISKWTRGRMAWVGSVVLAVALVLGFLVSSDSSVLRLGDLSDDDAPASAFAVAQHSATPVNADSLAQLPAKDQNGIPYTIERNVPLDNSAIAMNREVNLTSDQASVVKAFGEYLATHDQSAIVTSGRRTSEQQLGIIKERVSERGADSKFPQLDAATLADTKIWLRAWQWLRAKRVPVNAPAAVPGVPVKTSMHLKGLAIDFIADNLDHLRNMLNDFSRSKFSKDAALKITGIVREPGCVHINLG